MGQHHHNPLYREPVLRLTPRALSRASRPRPFAQGGVLRKVTLPTDGRLWRAAKHFREPGVAALSLPGERSSSRAGPGPPCSRLERARATPAHLKRALPLGGGECFVTFYRDPRENALYTLYWGVFSLSTRGIPERIPFTPYIGVLFSYLQHLVLW